MGIYLVLLTHIWCDKHPLRQPVSVEIFVELGEIHRQRQPCGIACHRVVAHERARFVHVSLFSFHPRPAHISWCNFICLLVFPNIAVPSVHRVGPVTKETCVGHVFLVQCPGDVLGLEQIHDGRHIRIDAAVSIISYPKG